jgi:hypothetical protein
MNQIQYPKGQNPLRLPFAAFRLIFGLEKTALLGAEKAPETRFIRAQREREVFRPR